MRSTLRRLRPGQLAALQWSDSVKHPGFFVDMRMGKCLLTIRRLKRWGLSRQHNVLIVCPNSAMKGWSTELTHESITHKRLIGSGKSREKSLSEIHSDDNTQVTLLNKEGFLSVPSIAKYYWWSVVIDESRCIANPKSKISKFYHSNFRSSMHRVILTGTADFKDTLDYFQQLTFLDYSNLPWKNFWSFKLNGFNQYGYTTVIKTSTKIY